MNDPNLTMEEYIQLEEEKARRRGQNFDWKSATYGKVNYFDDIDYFRDFETEFPAIVFDDISMSKTGTPSKPTIWLFHLGIRASVDDFDERLGKIFGREIHRMHVLDFGVPDKEDLDAYWKAISSEGDFLGSSPSYTAIRDPMLRLCHRLIACSIAGRSQAHEKVTVTDLFYLRGMDVDSVNVPYLLAQYLRKFASGRKHRALISGGQFVARLDAHFGLLTEQRLQGLTVVVRELHVIDMIELGRLQICKEIHDTWDWVALGPER
ncbi:hypothetical protein Tco_0854032 [Tanacetum coccineum]